jgi:hypothetical protein
VKTWGEYRLSELEQIPIEIAKWLKNGVESAVSANHIYRIMRAMWRRLAKLARE